MRAFAKAAQQAQLLLVEGKDPERVEAPPAIDPRPEMVCYRGQTLALVCHFFELSSQVGRLPSLLGREFFRARCSHHSVPSFEDQIVFVRDVELSLAKLCREHAEIVTLVGLYDFSYDEVAEMLHCSRGAISQLFAEALDTLSEIFLNADLLLEDRPDRRQRQLQDQQAPADAGAPKRKPPHSVKATTRSWEVITGDRRA